MHPEIGLLDRGADRLIAIAGCAVAALLAWLFPVEPAGRTDGPEVLPSVGSPPVSDAAQASIAVLPLENLSGTADDGLVAQGFSAEIVRALSGVPDLRIVPFLQSAAYAGRTLDEVASALNVRYILSGSLQRSAGRLRVIAMLTDARTGQQAWCESYERGVDDLFEVQRELAEAIAIETGSRYLNIVSDDLCRQPPQGPVGLEPHAQGAHVLDGLLHARGLSRRRSAGSSRRWRSSPTTPWRTCCSASC